MTGCSWKDTDNQGYQVYYTNQQRNMLLSASYGLKADDPLELAREMWEKMCNPGSASEQASLVPENLEAVVWDLTDGQLTVTFSAEYLNMDTIHEVLFRAGFVETVTQIPEVKKVVFHIGNAVLMNRSGEPIGAMTKNTFINNPVGINSYQYISLSLYFSNIAGDAVVKELRNLHYSTNTTLPKVVMEQLLKGPMSKSLRTVFSEDIKVLDIKVDEKTCTVNMNQAFLDAGEHLTMRPEVVIYSIVNSLCDVLNVDRIQFQIEGESNVVYGGSLNFGGPFHRNSEIISNQESIPDEGTGDNEQDYVEPRIGL